MLKPKQRAFLRKMAHDLDPIFQIGKAGVSPELVEAVSAALEARELIKVGVLKNCEDEIDVCADRLSARTHSDVVMMIGRRFVLYRRAKEPKIELPG